ncbi:MAG: hypothetical protein IJ763_09865 [Lachnospiraceae bacterium]|nr:hypothetical protein [Lachnospiraceae bacterium]
MKKIIKKLILVLVSVMILTACSDSNRKTEDDYENDKKIAVQMATNYVESRYSGMFTYDNLEVLKTGKYASQYYYLAHFKSDDGEDYFIELDYKNDTKDNYSKDNELYIRCDQLYGRYMNEAISEWFDNEFGEFIKCPYVLQNPRYKFKPDLELQNPDIRQIINNLGDNSGYLFFMIWISSDYDVSDVNVNQIKKKAEEIYDNQDVGGWGIVLCIYDKKKELDFDLGYTEQIIIYD